MKDAGFVDVTIKHFKLPTGPWPNVEQLRQSGLAILAATLDGVQGMSLAIFTRLLGWMMEELGVYLAMVRKEWKTKNIHSYSPWYVYFSPFSFSSWVYSAQFYSLRPQTCRRREGRP
jgi:hypothetical protein